MILATVGTQLPFPRLMTALNALAPRLEEPVIAQTGPDAGSYPALDCRPSLAPADFSRLFQEARVVVAHAGMGTILSARRWHKPLVILPRRHDLREHRNDHQQATARHVAALPGIHVAWTEEDLAALLTTPDLSAANEEPGQAYQPLLDRLRSFIDTV